MSEKRFKGIKILGKKSNEIFIKDKEKDYYIRTEDEVVELLNEQQATIDKQDEEIKKLKKTERSWRKIHCCNKESNNCGIVIEQQNTIEQLKAKLREKEEDEQLYANEILELREANKEFIQFKDLGGDY